MYTADETEIVVTWATVHHIDDIGQVEYGPGLNNLTNQINAQVTHFNHGVNLYTYRALLTQLKPDTRYCEYQNAKLALVLA